MGVKLFYTGIGIILALDRLLVIPAGEIVGAIFVLIGLILIWLDK